MVDLSLVGWSLISSLVWEAWEVLLILCLLTLLSELYYRYLWRRSLTSLLWSCPKKGRSQVSCSDYSSSTSSSPEESNSDSDSCYR